jgi:hypothetical protein
MIIIILIFLFYDHFITKNEFNSKYKMKKITIILIFLISVNSFSQDKNVKFGLKTSILNVKQKQSSYKISTPYLFSYSFGVFAETDKINDKVVIQPNLLFSVKGGGIDNVSSGGFSINKVTCNYVELPLNFLFSNDNKLLLGGGPYVGYFLNGKIGNEPYILSQTTSLKKIDLGYNAVLQYNIKKGFG